MRPAFGAKIPITRPAGRGKPPIDWFAAIPTMGDFPFAAASGTGHGVPKQPLAAKGSLAAIAQILIHMFNL